MILICCGIQEVTGFDWWKLAAMLVPLFIAFIAAYLAYKYAVKQLKQSHALTLKQLQNQHELALKQVENETPLLIQREKYNRMLNSLQACWGLLVFITDTENDKNMLRFTLNKDKSKTYFLNIPNAKAFMKALPEYFYDSGLGLYLPKPIRELLFEYRSILFGVLLSEDKNTDEQIILNNETMVKRMTDIHKELVHLLRKELDVTLPELPK
jgi:hypothetical protein